MIQLYAKILLVIVLLLYPSLAIAEEIMVTHADVNFRTDFQRPEVQAEEYPPRITIRHADINFRTMSEYDVGLPDEPYPDRIIVSHADVNFRTGFVWGTDEYNSPPSVPTLASPIDGSTISNPSPAVTINNSTDPDGDTLVYEFQLDDNSDFGSPEGLVTDLAKGTDLKTSWSTGLQLSDGTYYWRARAYDGQAHSDWMTASFHVQSSVIQMTIGLTEPSSDVTITQGDIVSIKRTCTGPTDSSVSLLRDDDNDLANGSSGEATIATNLLGSGTRIYMWDTSDVSPGIYYIAGRISTADGTESVHDYASGTVTIESSGPPPIGEVRWEYTASSDIQWLDHWEDGFATGDLNSDGIPDVVFGTISGEVVALDGSSGNELWDPFTIPDTAEWISADIVDIDGGALDIVAGGESISGNANIVALNSDGTLKWTFPTDYRRVTDFAYGDIDNDGDIDVAASIGTYTSGGGEVVLLDGNSGVKVWSSSLGTGVAYAVDAEDVNGDGDMEIAVTNYNDKIFLIDGKTSDIVWESDRNRYHGWDVEIEDLNNDGNFEILGVMGYIYCYEADGTFKWSSSRDLERLESGDVNDDGNKEIVAPASGKTYILDYAGKELWSREGSLPDLGDVDGDGVDDIVVGSGGVDVPIHYVVAVDGSGGLLWQYDLDTEPDAVVAADIDGDGDDEVLVAIGNKLIALDPRIDGETTDTTPPVITSGPTVSDITSTSVMITWTTDEKSDSVIEYGTSSAYGSKAKSAEIKGGDGITDHSGFLGSLSPGVTYHYRVSSTDASDNIVLSDDYTFTTLGEEPTGIPMKILVESPQPPATDFWVDIQVGDEGAPVDNLIGVSFKLECTNTEIIDALEAARGDFLGVDSLFFPDINNASGIVSVGISRKAEAGGASGYGTVAKVKMRFNSSISAGEQSVLTLTDVAAKDPDGNDIKLTPAGATVESGGLSVWPGDNNNSGLVDEQDVLPIGIYWAKTGPERSSASSSWVGQTATAWDPVEATYADANGDGVVDERDVLAIGINWHKTHGSTPSASPMLVANMDHTPYLLAYEELLEAVGSLPSEESTTRMQGILETVIRIGKRQIIPEKTAVLQNYPNPFNPETWIPFQLAEDAEVRITIYSASGLLIRTLNLGPLSPGTYTDKGVAAHWDGRNDHSEQASSGIYFCHVQAGDFTAIKKMILAK